MIRTYEIQIRDVVGHGKYRSVASNLTATQAKRHWEGYNIFGRYVARLLEFDGYITKVIARKGEFI